MYGQIGQVFLSICCFHSLCSTEVLSKVDVKGGGRVSRSNGEWKLKDDVKNAREREHSL